MLVNLNNELLQIIFGIVLVIISIYYFYNKKIPLKYSIRNSIIIGCLAGILGGLFNADGTPLVIYFLATSDDKYSYYSSLQLIFLLTLGFTLIYHFYLGNFNYFIYQRIISGFIALFAGYFIGVYFFKKINLYIIELIVKWLLLISGISILFSTIT